MSKLPSISGRACIKALERAGFVVRRQEGSHVVLDRGTLRAIIRQADLTVDEFLHLL
jgi:predicted RNA binding protein YcfA (HicA-like mRNA interferase family)